jgi:modification methylase
MTEDVRAYRAQSASGDPAGFAETIEDLNATAADALGSIWATGQTDLATQLARHGYHVQTANDPALMPPAIAEHVIATLTRPGDLVLDPDCGAGTTLVEALRGARHTIGLTSTRRWWQLARANVTATKAAGAPMDGMVLILDRQPSTLATAQVAGFTGRVDLVLTTLRLSHPGPGAGALRDAVDRLRRLLAECRPLVRPGGHVVVTTPPWRDPDRVVELLDVPGQILSAGAATGFVPVARCIALTAPVHTRRAHLHGAPAQRRARGRLRRLTGHPVALPAHHTALVFRVDPAAADVTVRLPIPPLPLRPSRPGRHHRADRQAA